MFRDQKEIPLRIVPSEEREERKHGGGGGLLLYTYYPTLIHKRTRTHYTLFSHFSLSLPSFSHSSVYFGLFCFSVSVLLFMYGCTYLSLYLSVFCLLHFFSFSLSLFLPLPIVLFSFSLSLSLALSLSALPPPFSPRNQIPPDKRSALVSAQSFSFVSMANMHIELNKSIFFFYSDISCSVKGTNIDGNIYKSKMGKTYTKAFRVDTNSIQ